MKTYLSDASLASFTPQPFRRYAATGALVMALTFGLAGCSTPSSSEAGQDTVAEATSSEVVLDASAADVEGMDFDYSNRDTDPSYDEATATKINLSDGTVEGSGASFDATTSTWTVDAEGTYLLSGSLSEGMVVVDADKDNDKIQLVLAGASITHETGPAIEVLSADKVFITLADSTTNNLQSGANFTLEEGEDEPHATLYSKEDLTLNGTGTLNVEGAYRHGIASKDDLVITGGTYVIEAAEDGLFGKDCIKIAGGDITVMAGSDGLKSTNDSDPVRGFISIDGGTVKVTAGDDGVDAQTYWRVMDGAVTVVSADDAFHSEVHGRIAGGTLDIDAGDDAFHVEYTLTVDDGDVTVRSCTEGYEGQQVIVNGGNTSIVASDDAVNASAPDTGTDSQAVDGEGDQAPTMPEGFEGIEPPTGMPGADGSAPQGDPQAQGAPMAQAESPMGNPMGGEMPEGDGVAGQMPVPAPGETSTQGEVPDGVTADQGFGGRGDAMGHRKGEFAQSDQEQSAEGEAAAEPWANGERGGGRGGFGGPGGGGMGTVSEDCLIQINGGTLILDAGGDGIDSNGSVEITGGTVLVSGPANSADGALDYELEATISGGSVLLAGPAGMAASFTGGIQPFALVSAQEAAGSTITLKSAQGESLVSMTAVRAFQTVVVSAPGLTEGESVSVVVTNASGQESTASATVSTEPSAQGGFGGPAMGGRMRA